MWALFCPIKTGTPVSRLASRVSVVDTGTRADETGFIAEAVIRCCREKALDWGVQRMSNTLWRHCFSLTFATEDQYAESIRFSANLSS
jgi:hypothetical protein